MPPANQHPDQVDPVRRQAGDALWVWRSSPSGRIAAGGVALLGAAVTTQAVVTAITFARHGWAWALLGLLIVPVAVAFAIAVFVLAGGRRAVRREGGALRVGGVDHPELGASPRVEIRREPKSLFGYDSDQFVVRVVGGGASPEVASTLQHDYAWRQARRVAAHYGLPLVDRSRGRVIAFGADRLAGNVTNLDPAERQRLAAVVPTPFATTVTKREVIFTLPPPRRLASGSATALVAAAVVALALGVALWLAPEAPRRLDSILGPVGALVLLRALGTGGLLTCITLGWRVTRDRVQHTELRVEPHQGIACAARPLPWPPARRCTTDEIDAAGVVDEPHTALVIWTRRGAIACEGSVSRDELQGIVDHALQVLLGLTPRPAPSAADDAADAAAPRPGPARPAARSVDRLPSFGTIDVAAPGAALSSVAVRVGSKQGDIHAHIRRTAAVVADAVGAFLDLLGEDAAPDVRARLERRSDSPACRQAAAVLDFAAQAEYGGLEVDWEAALAYVESAQRCMAQLAAEETAVVS